VRFLAWVQLNYPFACASTYACADADPNASITHATHDSCTDDDPFATITCTTIALAGT
jgi:hypothetical protein